MPPHFAMRAFRQSAIGQLIFGAIIVAIILAFIISGNAQSTGTIDDECAVEVGDTCVQPKEFIAAYGLVTAIGINEQAAKRLELKKQIALGLAERVVLEQEAKRLGVSTSEADVDQELAEGRARVSLPAKGADRLAMNLALCADGPEGCAPGSIGVRSLPVKRDGNFDFDRYQRVVRNVTGRSPAQFKELQERELTAERVREVIRQNVKISTEEAFLTYSRARSEAIARVTRLDTGWFQRFLVRVASAEVDAYLAAHGTELDALAKEAEGSWAVDCPVVSEIRLDGTDVDAERKLRALLPALSTAEGFERAARTSSIAESAKNGGYVGCLEQSYGPNADALLAAAAKLTKAGALSEIVLTSDGPTVLRLDSRVTAETRDTLLRNFHAARLASAEAAAKRAEVYASALIARVRGGEAMEAAVESENRAALAGSWFEVKPTALGAAASENAALASPIRPLSDISRSFNIEQDPISDSTSSESIGALLFALPDLDAVLDQPVPTRSGFAVLQLKSRDLVTREKFEEDRPRVIASLRAAKAAEVLDRFVSNAIEKLGGVRLNESYVPASESSSPEGAASKTPG